MSSFSHQFKKNFIGMFKRNNGIQGGAEPEDFDVYVKSKAEELMSQGVPQKDALEQAAQMWQDSITSLPSTIILPEDQVIDMLGRDFGLRSTEDKYAALLDLVKTGEYSLNSNGVSLLPPLEKEEEMVAKELQRNEKKGNLVLVNHTAKSVTDLHENDGDRAMEMVYVITLRGGYEHHDVKMKREAKLNKRERKYKRVDTK